MNWLLENCPDDTFQKWWGGLGAFIGVEVVGVLGQELRGLDGNLEGHIVTLGTDVVQLSQNLVQFFMFLSNLSFV